MRSKIGWMSLLLVASACTGDESHVTQGGKGKPVVVVELPEETARSSEQTARVIVSNPGPQDMRTIVVAFATVGPVQGETEIPTSIVSFGSVDPTILSVDPEPTATSRDRVVYTFGPVCPDGGDHPADCPEAESRPRLPEGGSITIAFRMVMPVVPGPAANSVQVYDGTDVDRAAGGRLETIVGR